jgi:phage recombination protein Bet
MTGTDVATTQSPGVLALRGDQADWTPAQRAALSQIGIADAPPGDQQVFLHVAQRSGLDPFARQIYMISRWDWQSQQNKWTIQTGIDGYRVIAERRPQYGGQLGPQWCGDDGEWRDVWTSKTPPVAARVGVVRKDWDHPIWGVAHFAEFAATKKDGNLTQMWATKGRHQIAKCAEAAALRKAFPQDFVGVYMDDEMEHLDNPVPRVVIESERDDLSEPEPNWDALLAQYETDQDRNKLGDLWKLARGLRRNDTALHERIAQAGERVKRSSTDKVTEMTGTAAEGESSEASPEERKKHLRHVFALLREGGIGTDPADRVSRLRIASRLLNRPTPLGTFDELTDAEIATLIEFMVRHKSDGDLTPTLASLAQPTTKE